MRFLSKKNIFKLSLLATAVMASSAMAGGFQLYEQNADDLGTYHAGSAAKASTAATEFYNPAGMVRLKHTAISLGATNIALNTYFKGHVGDLTPSTPAEGSGNTNNIVPNAHIVVPFSYKDHPAAFGFGINTPFGLSTNYPKSTLTNTIGLAGTNTTVMTVNIGPSLALALTPKFSIGAGVDLMYAKADYNGDYDLTLGRIDLPLAHYTNHLEGTGWGFNLGALWQPSSTFRMGFAYRSPVIVSAHGPSREYDDAGTLVDHTTATATIALPANYTLSAYKDLSSRWSVMGTVVYGEWNIFKSLTINNVAVIPFDPTGVNITENYKYKNTWMGSVGTQYWFSARNAIQFGFGLDQTPTRDGHRDTRLPDGNRWIAALGLKHKFNCRSSITAGYAYVDMGKVNIDNSKNSPIIHEKGTSTGHANIVGVQLNYQFS